MSFPDINEDDIKEVLGVIKSGRLALGPKTISFENAMADYIGVKHAIAVSSGTSALHLIVRSLGLGPGDEVLVPSFTFVASVNAILFERAKPIFVDIEGETFNIDPEDLERKITPKTKAIMVVDVFGHPAEWDSILKIAEEYDLKIIDDSCEALGAEYKGRKIGSFGDAAAFAFYPNKQITTGEGGIIVTNDDNIAQAARSMRNQGRNEMSAWLEHQILGFNYRMDEMSAALGLSQLKRIESFLQKRERVASYYTELLSEVEEIETPIVKPYVRMSWFVYVVKLKKGLDRDKIIKKLQEKGVPARGYFSPIHLQPYIRVKYENLERTEDIAKRTLALPFHNNMKEEEIKYVVQILKESVI